MTDAAGTAGARLLGTWALESFTLDLADGTRLEPMGAQPSGRLVYTAGGFMSAHLQAAGADATTLAYCGRWRTDGDRVTHDVELSTRAGMAGRPQVRGVGFEGDRLVLTAEGAREGMGAEARRGTGRLRWRRIEAPEEAR